MNKIVLVIYLILIFYLCFLTYSLATDYQDHQTRNRVSFLIWTIDTIDLFIHEAGHLIFGIFGRFIGFLGGSLFQVIIPVAVVIVFGRAHLESLPFSLYWTGQSMVNVSIYIGDAPYRKLHLISRAAIHDWHWILNTVGMMEYAGELAWIVNTLGLLVCATGIGIGFYLVVRHFKQMRLTNTVEAE